MADMKKIFFTGMVLAVLATASVAWGQRDKDSDNEPTALINFLVVKDDNGKPVRNAAVIMHEVNCEGQAGTGGHGTED
jgi:hypothetical protein